MTNQEQFDILADRIQSNADEWMMGSFTRTIDLGQVAVRCLAFIPRQNQPGYSPEIHFQDLVEAQAHNGLFWAPVSQIGLRRSKLDHEDTAENLTKLELALDLFEKF